MRQMILFYVGEYIALDIFQSWILRSYHEIEGVDFDFFLIFRVVEDKKLSHRTDRVEIEEWRHWYIKLIATPLLCADMHIGSALMTSALQKAAKYW